ncbi:MAG: hypothetical protein SVZ03_08400 [Spirochaetota bacterium]|nr:hypothetical protein [Spirochaetota bacterium]
MKKIIYTFFLIIIILFVGYVIVNCIVKIEDSTFSILIDKKNDSIRILKDKYNFVWQGIIPRRIQLNTYRKKNNVFFDLKIPIPPFEEMKGDLYSIQVPINIDYIIDPIKFPFTTASIKDGSKAFNKEIDRIFKGYLKRELYSYFLPSYRGEALYRDKELIISRVADTLKEKSLSNGITIHNIEILGGFELPNSKTYYNGLRFYNELRRIEEDNEKELLKLSNKLQKEKLFKNKYYDELNKISKMIERNPDLLKYIYIDKMAKNVKLIISSADTGMPFGLGFDEDSNTNRTEREIDNLR